VGFPGRVFSCCHRNFSNEWYDICPCHRWNFDTDSIFAFREVGSFKDDLYFTAELEDLPDELGCYLYKYFDLNNTEKARLQQHTSCDSTSDLGRAI
jgi:hypothetical protein